MAEEREGKNPVQSAERIFQVMETLADHGEMGLMELSTALDLHKSTVHRLLMSLIYMGYAKQDEATQKYMLSYKVVNMAGKILERMDILQVAKPYMERLSDLSGEAVHLVQREGNHILYIYKIEAKVGTIRMVSHVGMVHPMYCSGVGKAIMATLPDEEVKKIWNESIIEKKTDKTITDFSQMQEVLEEVRQNGYALDDEEKDKILSKAKANQKPDISRFKGLGEMSALQLKETTMDKNNRVLLRVVIPTANTEEARDEAFETRRQVERLMGKDPEQRFKFIIERAKFAEDLDI